MSVNQTLTVDQALSLALDLQRDGAVGEAEAIYRQVLTAVPQHRDALHLLGIALMDQGRAEEGRRQIQAAIALAPGIGVFHLSLGNALRALGYAREAAAAYRQALALDAGLADAAMNLGRLALESGEEADAEEYFRHVLLLRPEHGEAHQILGEVQHDRGMEEAAAAHLLAAEAVLPPEAERKVRLGYVLYALGQLEEASSRFVQALAKEPTHAVALHGLGIVSLARDDLDAAAEAFRAALEARPDYVEALNNYSAVEKRRGAFGHARQLSEEALRLRPDDPVLLGNLAMVVFEEGDWDEARAIYGRMLAANADCALAHYGLSSTLVFFGDLDGAEAHARRAAILDPDNYDVHNNLGLIAMRRGEHGEARCHFDRALALKPGDADVLLNRATSLLAAGRFADGWPDYRRYRLSSERKVGLPPATRHFPQPYWEGDPLGARALLVWGEQGIADELWMASLLPELIEQGARLILECEPRLVGLFRRSFPQMAVVPRENPPLPETSKADLQCSLADLPVALRPGIEDFSRQPRRYLRPDAAAAQVWRERLAKLGSGLKVGLSWRSTLGKARMSGAAYPELEAWGRIFSLPGIQWISLQYDRPEDDLRYFKQHFGVAPHVWDDLDLKDDQEGLAALMGNLDLVVGPANAPAVLAAGLGVPTVFLWSYMLRISWRTHGLEHTPWFPEAALLQRNYGDSWEQVLERLAAMLEARRA